MFEQLYSNVALKSAADKAIEHHINMSLGGTRMWEKSKRLPNIRIYTGCTIINPKVDLNLAV